ncbi:MAG TPA: CYTH and CHAD domain-containing protein [Gaiellaceae bacterium]|nr:CYTH and CHAD domain-containing protein [Gaiellaceae bacterium]
MRTTVERELKLDPGEGFQLPELPGEALESRLFTSTYYDTAERSLSQAGITLRRRVENGLSRWQLKLPRAGFARAELEAGGGPAGPPVEMAALLVAHLRHAALEPVATLRTRRGGVRVREGTTIVADVTLDVVDVLEGARAAGHFAEIEVELVDGSESDLERIGQTLRRAGARRANGQPKLMRVLPAPPLPEQPDRVRALLAEQLYALRSHDPGVRLGADPEDLHKFRVATRRTRAIARATKPILGDTLRDLNEELKWLAGILGPVRDLDVMIDQVRGGVAELGPDTVAGEEVVSALTMQREDLREVMHEAMDSDRYFALLEQFAETIETLPGISDKELAPLAKRELKKLERAAHALPDDPEDAALHELRIKAKRARYSAELLESDKQVTRYIDALKDLQDVVGEHQDSVVAEDVLRKLSRAKTAVAVGRLVEREHERRKERRAAYPSAIADALRNGHKVFD